MLALSVLSVLFAAAGPPPRGVVVGYSQVIVRSHVVVRIRSAPATPLPIMFREKKGPRCVPMAEMAGAAVIERSSVDLALRRGKRMRARFGASCPGLDFYSGFYIAPTVDGMLCARRDTIRDRAGGECAVEQIRELVPRR